MLREKTAPLHPLTPPDGRPRVSHGFVLRDGRRGGFCWEEKPRCISAPGDQFGHRLKPRGGDRPVRHDTIVECVHGARAGVAGCGRQQYVARLTFGGSAKVRGTGEIVWLVVEVTDEHIRRMKHEPMIFLETLQLLDCVLPGVEIDLAAGITPPPDAGEDGHADDR